MADLEQGQWAWADGVDRKPNAEIIFPWSRPNAVVASARQLNIAEEGESKRASHTQQSWYTHAWNLYEDVPEISFGVNWAAWNISKLHIFPATVPDPTRPPVPSKDPRAWEAINRLRVGSGSISEILRRWVINWLVTADCYLVGLDRGAEGERWSLVSTEDLEIRNGAWKFHEQSGQIRDINPKADFVLRLWIPHARKAQLSHSAIRAVLDPAELVLYLSRLTRSNIRSRLSAGILKLPSELTFGSTDKTQDSDPTKDNFFASFGQALVDAIDNSGSAADVVPIIVRGPAEILRALDILTPDRPLDEQIDRLMERNIRRLAQGLPVPAEIILGMTDATGWSAWKVSEDAWTQHLEPLALSMVQSLTSGYLWPYLNVTNPGPDTPIIWYDPSAVIARPDRAADYKDAFDRKAISFSALREGMRMPEEYAPSVEELAMREVSERGMFDAFLTEALVRVLWPEIELPDSIHPTDQVGKTFGQPNLPKYDAAAENSALPAETSPSEPSASHTTPIANTPVGERIVGATDSAIRRAMERAGARIRSAAQKDRALMAELGASPNSHVAAVLGSARVTTLGLSTSALLDGAFTDLKDQFTTWLIRDGNTTAMTASAWSTYASQIQAICQRNLFGSHDDMEIQIRRALESAMTVLNGR